MWTFRHKSSHIGGLFILLPSSAALAAMMCAVTASAATYEVNSIATLQSTIDNAGAGDVIIMHNGVYTTDAYITINRQGTREASSRCGTATNASSTATIFETLKACGFSATATRSLATTSRAQPTLISATATEKSPTALHSRATTGRTTMRSRSTRSSTMNATTSRPAVRMGSVRPTRFSRTISCREEGRPPVGDFAAVDVDMDGQPRQNPKDRGADEISDAPVAGRF